MSGDWKRGFENLWGLAEKVEMLGFVNPGMVLNEFRGMAKHFNYHLIVQVTLSLAESDSMKELVSKLERVIDYTFDHDHVGVTELLRLWELANEYDFQNWRPSDPGVARMVSDAIRLFEHLHTLHRIGEGSLGVPHENAVAAGERALVNMIGERVRPKADGLVDDGTRIQMITPDVETQEKVLDFLLTFETMPEKPPHKGDDPVRVRMQQLAVELVASESYDLSLIRRMLEESRNADRQVVLERGLVKKVGRHVLLRSYFGQSGA